MKKDNHNTSHDKQSRENTEISKISTAFSNITIACHYPDKNPEGTLDDVTNTLSYVGVFDNID